MKEEEPQIHGKYWRHETGGRYKQEKTEYRACRGNSWDREKSRAIQKVPCGEESGGDAEGEKEYRTGRGWTVCSQVRAVLENIVFSYK